MRDTGVSIQDGYLETLTGKELAGAQHSARHYYRLEHYDNTGEWMTIEEASKTLGVSHTVIRRLIREQTLPASQVVASAPWIIRNEDLSLPAVQAEVNAVREGRQLPATDPRQHVIPWK